MISVIIPAYNEAPALPATLARLFEQAGEFEAILSDGASTDATLAVASRYSALKITSAPRGRASQMNAGARRAGGEWLLFLHADTLLPRNALLNIEALGADIKAGGFRHKFSGRGAGLRLVSLLDNIRCRSTRVIYGDQAMFIRRSLFYALDGFPETTHMEDALFCGKLVKKTRPMLMPDMVITDARKFVRMGVWRSLARVVLILVCTQLHLPLPRTALRFFENIR